MRALILAITILVLAVNPTYAQTGNHDSDEPVPERDES
jgi:hypothetical protein